MRVYVLLVIGLRLFGAASTFFVSLVVARVLGVDSAGQFILSINAVLFLAIVARQGADSLALKVVAILANQVQPAGIADFLRRHAVRTLRLSVPICALILLGLTLVPLSAGAEVYGPVWRWLAPALIFLSVMGILSTSFQALDKALLAICFQAIGVNMAVILAAAAGVDTAGGLAASFAVASLALVGLGGLEIGRSLKKMQGTPKSDAQQETHREDDEARASRAFWVIAILQNLQVWGAQYIAGAVLPSADLSALVVAQQCSLILTLILQAVIMIYAPKFAVLHKHAQMDALQALCQKVVMLITAAVMPLFLVLVIFPTPVMSIFGEGFDAGVPALRILAVGQLLNAMTGPVGMLLMMTGHERLYRSLLLIFVPTALLVAAVVGAVLGVIGFAIVTAVTLASTNLIAIWLVRRNLGISPTPWL